MKFRIRINSKAEKHAALQLLEKFTDGKLLTISQMDMGYCYVYVNYSGDIMCNLYDDLASVYDYATELPLIIEKLLNQDKEYVVDGVGDHQARITNKGILLGCQTVSFEKFGELAENVKKFQAER